MTDAKLQRLQELLAGIHVWSHQSYDQLHWDILDQLLMLKLGRLTLPW